MKFPGNREMVVSRGLCWPNKELLMWNTESGPHKIQISLTQKSQQIQPRNPQDNLVGDLRLSLPLFTTWWSHTHTDQKLITWCFHKNELKLLMISLAIHFPSNLSHSVTRRLLRFEGAFGGFFVSNPTPQQLLSFESHLFPQSQLTSSYSFFFLTWSCGLEGIIPAA